MMQTTDLEKFILSSVDHTDGYPTLWFPKVRREDLNFPAGSTDAEIHRALLRLIRMGAIMVLGPTGRISGNFSLEVLQDLPANGHPTNRLVLEEGMRHRLHAARERSKIPLRGHFEVFAHGDDFDVNTYLKSTSLDFDHVWHRQEGGRPTKRGGEAFGDGAVLSFDEQQRMGFEYISANRDALHELANFPGVTTFILGLQYNIEVTGVFAGFASRRLQD